MVTAYLELEIALRRGAGDRHRVELTLFPSHGDSTKQVLGEEAPLLRFDLPRLRELQCDSAAYGRHLGRNLFADPSIEDLLDKVRSRAQESGVRLRLRLAIDPEAPELHDLCWETLCDPQDRFLLQDAGLLFSRYTGCQGMRLGPRVDLHALALVASPANLRDPPAGTWLPPPPNLEGELAHIRSYLDPLPVTVPDPTGSASLEVMVREPGTRYEVLYLVCQATAVGGEVWLWLQDAAGQAAVVAGSELIGQLRQRKQRPRVVVLAPCLSSDGSGSSSDEGALATLGPRLAGLGVPAVLAMQGNVTRETLDRFMPTFFRELQGDGQIDRAMALARAAVGERPDWWVPVLFTCARSGRLWYVPGFARRERDHQIWPSLLQGIEQARCTPILGPGLIEPFIGSQREIAQRWAERHEIPVATPGQEDLIQVAQYLSVRAGRRLPVDELQKDMCQEILDRYGNDLRPDGRQAPLDDLLAAAGARRRQQDPAESYRVLAQLPLPLYLMAEPTNLLADALFEAGREPVVDLCRWSEHIVARPSILEREPAFRPSEARPLVYHLFGHVAEPDTLALTEDDYYEYLINVTGSRELFPNWVRHALADSALLFLGFETDSRSFGILYRSIAAQGSGRWRRDYRNIIQLEPAEGSATTSPAASRYLQRYFGEADTEIDWGTVEPMTVGLGDILWGHEADIEIYWGTVQHFLGELWRLWRDSTDD